MMLYIATKKGRVLQIVDTRDTGPLAIAQNWSTVASITSISLKVSMVKADFNWVISLSCWIVLGRIEIISEIPDRQKIERL